MDIIVADVTFAYSPQVIALREVSLTIEAGESVAIIGENGAGKTTLVKHLNGLLLPASGRVTIGGWDTKDYSTGRLARRVGFAFQNPDDQLFKRTVASEVAFGPEMLGFSAQEVQSAVTNALRITGLSDYAQTHPHDLHNSQRRLVALAATLALNTPIMVIDEPTIGQDAGGVRKIEAIIAGLVQNGRTVIAISHDIEFCARNFARIVLMAGGRILADGRPAQLFSQADLLSAAHIQPPQIMRLAEALDLPGSIVDIATFLAAYENRALRE